MCFLPNKRPNLNETKKHSVDRLAQGALAAEIGKVGEMQHRFERRYQGPQRRRELPDFIPYGKRGFVKEACQEAVSAVLTLVK